MADKEAKKPAEDKPAASVPRFDPKPVQLGGESLLDRVRPHMKKIAVATVISAAVIGIIFGVLALRDRKYAKETERMSAVLEVAARPVRAEPVGSGSAAAKKDDSFASEKDKANATLDAITKHDADAPPAFRGSLLVQAGKLDEAIKEYRAGQGQIGIDGVLAREGLGLALEMKAEQDKDAAARQKGLEDALAAFQAMQPDEKGPRRAYALYHQGRILGLLGKKAEAKTAFEKAKELGKDSEVGELADERLASLGAT